MCSSTCTLTKGSLAWPLVICVDGPRLIECLPHAGTVLGALPHEMGFIVPFINKQTEAQRGSFVVTQGHIGSKLVESGFETRSDKMKLGHRSIFTNIILFPLNYNVYIFYRLHRYRYYLIFDPQGNFVAIIVVFIL